MRLTRLVGLVFCLCIALGWSVASPVRRGAFVPGGSLPSRVGAPMDQGQIRVAFEMNSAEFTDGLGSIIPGDFEEPGVYRPYLQFGGNAYVAATDWVELGTHVRGASFNWTEPNRAGIPPFPTGPNPLITYGGGARFNIRPPGDLVVVSILTEFNISTIQEVQARCSLCTDSGFVRVVEADEFATFDTDGDGVLSDAELYEIEGVERTNSLHPNYGVSVNVEPADGFWVSGFVGGTTQVENVGFDFEESESDISNYTIGMFSLGADYHAEPISAGVHAMFPVGGPNEIEHAPALMVQIGWLGRLGGGGGRLE